MSPKRSYAATLGDSKGGKKSFSNINMSKLPKYLNPKQPTPKRVADLLQRMSLSQKVGQMIQAEWPHITPQEMAGYELGSLLSGGESWPPENNIEGWKKLIHDYQTASLSTDLKIPAIFGIDAVHGHSKVYGATVFPHNIGLGAGNDEKGLYKMGEIVAKEVFATGFNWNFSPCVAIANDPRWGRTYESFSTDPKIVNRLGLAFTSGQMAAGMVACAKHYLGDGGTKMGTGWEGKLDHGNTILSEAEIRKTLLPAYEAQVKVGVQTIMPSYSSLNGVKMHQNKEYIMGFLKGELGFKGFVVTDWEGIQEIPNANYEEQIWIAINAGIDMLMEPKKWKSAFYAVKRGVENGHILEERIEDAVERILTVKFDSGLFEDPIMANRIPKVKKFRTKSAKKTAQDLAEKSLVLLKNEANLLPIKSGTKIYAVGAGVNNIGLQCGGWTMDWNGLIDGAEKITEGITILEGLKNVADSKNLTIIRDKKAAKNADIVLQVLSEIPYAEMQGDSEDISLTGIVGHPENAKTMAFTKSLNKPIVTIILAGRHLADLAKDFVDWNSCIMAYLPGSEGGQAIAEILVGSKKINGKLPMPWYQTVVDIEKETPELLFEIGYGLEY